MIRKTLVVSLLAAATSAQTPNATELQDVLRQADRRRAEYVETFKSLTAVETRLTQLFDKSGQVERHSTVVSDFLVYQSELKDGGVSEYRIAREVDGKAVRNPTEDAIGLFQRLAKARTLAQQQQQLRAANLKHVLPYVSWGRTLNQVQRACSIESGAGGRERAPAGAETPEP